MSETFQRQGRVDETNRVLSVALTSSNALAYYGAANCVRSCSQIEVLPTDQSNKANVIVAIEERVDDLALKRVRTFQKVHNVVSTTPCVLVTNELHQRNLKAAVALGTAAIVQLNGPAIQENLIEAILLAGRGHASFPTSIQRSLLGQLQKLNEIRSEPELTQREIGVLMMLSEGMDTSEIARRLLYSERTIKGIVHQVVARFGFRNRTQAVAYAAKNGFL